jgi:hypothetical protein
MMLRSSIGYHAALAYAAPKEPRDELLKTIGGMPIGGHSFSVIFSLFGCRDAIFFDEPIEYMEEDGVGQSHANGIVAVVNRFGEIREEHICEGRVHCDNVCSGLLGQSMRCLERLMLIVVCAAAEVWYFFNFCQKWKERCGIGFLFEESIKVWRSGTEHVHGLGSWRLMCLSTSTNMEHEFN